MNDNLQTFFSQQAAISDQYLDDFLNKYSESEGSINKETSNLKESNNSYKIFNQRWMAYAYAVFLGFHYDVSEPIDKDTRNRDRFKLGVIFNQNRPFALLLIMLALGKCTSLDEILNKQKIINIIAEHAKGGAKKMEKMTDTSKSTEKTDGIYDFLSAQSFTQELKDRITNTKSK